MNSEEKPETKEKVVAKTAELDSRTKESLPNVSYKKEFVTFMIKPIHISQCNRWAKWCADRGFETQHNKAFAIAMDILEGRTQDLINQSKHLESIEKVVHAHDLVLKNILTKIDEIKSEPQEELNPNELARKKREEQLAKKRQVMEDKK